MKILEYFDESYSLGNCEMCSNYIKPKTIESLPMNQNNNYASDEEIDKLSYLDLDTEEELHVVLLKVIANDKRIPKKDFVNILNGKLHRFSAKWKFELNAYGLLAGKEGIEDIMNRLVSDLLVEINTNKEIKITKKGISFLQKKISSPFQSIPSISLKDSKCGQSCLVSQGQEHHICHIEYSMKK